MAPVRRPRTRAAMTAMFNPLSAPDDTALFNLDGTFASSSTTDTALNSNLEAANVSTAASTSTITFAVPQSPLTYDATPSTTSGAGGTSSTTLMSTSPSSSLIPSASPKLALSMSPGGAGLMSSPASVPARTPTLGSKLVPPSPRSSNSRRESGNNHQASSPGAGPSTSSTLASGSLSTASPSLASASASTPLARSSTQPVSPSQPSAAQTLARSNGFTFLEPLTGQTPIFPLRRQSHITMGGRRSSRSQAARRVVSHAAKKPDGHIPRPPNCFLLYRSWVRAQNKLNSTRDGEQGKKNEQKVSVIVGTLWEDLPEEKKEIFRAEARRLKEEHMKRYPGYKYTPRSRKQNANTASTPVSDGSSTPGVVSPTIGNSTANNASGSGENVKGKAPGSRASRAPTPAGGAGGAMSPKNSEAAAVRPKRSTRKMAPEDLASSIRHATALMPHQRALEEKLLGPLTANHGSPFGNHHGTSSSTPGAGNGGATGTTQGQSENPFPSLSFGLGLGPGASAGFSMFHAKDTRRDVAPTSPSSSQQQPDSSSAAGIVAPQPQSTTTMVTPAAGTGKPPIFIQYRRSSSAPPAPPVLATLYPPGTASTAPDQQAAEASAQPTQPEQQQQTPRSPTKAQRQASQGVGAQRRHHQHVNSAGSNTGAPYARPAAGGGGVAAAPSRRMVAPGGVGAAGAQPQSDAAKARRPTPRLIMPFEMPTAPVIPSIGSSHTSRSGTPMSAPVMPTHPHQAHYHPHPLARQGQDGEDEDAREVIEHLEQIRRMRGEQAPLFDPGFSFPTSMAPSASGADASSHHQGAVPRQNGGPGAGGRPMIGRRYDPPSYPPPMDEAAFQQQQALFANHAHQPSHHQPPHAHQHHEQQHFSPAPQQDYWTAHPDGTYINGHVSVHGLDEFSALGTGMDLDPMVLDNATFDAQQMQLRQAFEQSQQQHHFDTPAPTGDYVPSPISTHFDPSTGQPTLYPQHHHQQPPAVEFPQDYSMAVHTPHQQPHPSSSKLPPQPLMRRSATSGPSALVTGSPGSSVSTGPTHTPPAGGALPLRLPTPNNNAAGSNLVPRPGTETFFDWNPVASPLPPHSAHPDVTTAGGPEDPSPLQMPPQHTLNELSTHSGPMTDLELKFDFNTTMHQQAQEGHDGGAHSHSHTPLDVDPLSHLGLPLSPHPTSQTGLHDPYSSDAFPQTHRPSMYGFNSNFDAGFAQATSSSTTTASYHQHPSASNAAPPSGSWTGSFGFGSFGSGSMSGSSGAFGSSNTGLGAYGTSSGAAGMSAVGGLTTGAGGGLAGRRLSRRASSFWSRRASLAGDLAGVGRGEF